MNTHKQSWTLILPNYEFNEHDTIHLNNDDKHYLLNVLRLSNNDFVDISNGNGLKATGVISKLNKKEGIVYIKEIKEVTEPKIFVHLVLGKLKPAALEEAVKMSSEVGISSIHIFDSENSSFKQNLKLEKLQKIAFESLRVSKSAYAPKIFEHKDLKSCFLFLDDNYSNFCFIFCDETSTFPIGKLNIEKNMKHIFILIGAEASFSQNERSQIMLLSNCLTASLGKNILRAPIAAVCASFSVLNNI